MSFTYDEIKSQAYQACKELVETYAVKIDPELHAEVIARNKALNIEPYGGFVNPNYHPVYDAAGNIVDVTITYDSKYIDQHLEYSSKYSFLPTFNKFTPLYLFV